jgi:hypothetical protein
MKPYSLFAVAIAASAVSTPVGSQSAQNTAVTLALPIACELGRTCEIQNYVDRDKGPAATDYLCGSVSYNDHSGVDFRILDMVAQRRGVSVLAAASGKVTAIRDGVADVSVRDIDRATIAGRECGNGVVIDHGGGLTTQYCHMAKGSIAVASGMQVSSGAVLGRVGFATLRVNFCASETLIPPNLAHYLKKVASEIPCFRETSAVDIPSAY